MTGRVIRATGGIFFVKTEMGEVAMRARGIIRNDDEIIAGDIVHYESDQALITSVENRKNRLIRPPIANIDKLIIVIAPLPKPDLYLVDKLIVGCHMLNIDAVLCLNKSDLQNSDDFYQAIKKAYQADVLSIVTSCAKDGEISQLMGELKNSLSCFAGQSAVGKSTLINALLKKDLQKTDDLSQKVDRGRHTTRTTEIFDLECGGFIADTPGFSRYNLLQIEKEDLNYYYNDFVALKDNCRYSSCTHINEPDCAVIDAVNTGEICKDRWLRYTEIFNEIKNTKKY